MFALIGQLDAAYNIQTQGSVDFGDRTGLLLLCYQESEFNSHRWQ
jgi:hypothetical protein